MDQEDSPELLAEFAEVSDDARRIMAFYASKGKPAKITRQTIVEQFHRTFELIGGVPRLAVWADQNPGQFYQLYSKLLPAAVKAELNLPPNVDNLTPDQIKSLSTDSLKRMLLLSLMDPSNVVDAELVESAPKSTAANSRA